jgi:hypothetical protein
MGTIFFLYHGQEAILSYTEECGLSTKVLMRLANSLFAATISLGKTYDS